MLLNILNRLVHFHENALINEQFVWHKIILVCASYPYKSPSITNLSVQSYLNTLTSLAETT